MSVLKFWLTPITVEGANEPSTSPKDRSQCDYDNDYVSNNARGQQHEEILGHGLLALTVNRKPIRVNSRNI